MLDFQYFVIADQLHKEKLALKGAQMVPEENVLIIYDRALFDDKAYITDEQFREILAYFGKTEQEVLAGYDAVLHLVSCAKGAEFAYNFGNEARYEPLETAREKDDLTLRAWKDHPNLKVIDNAVDFEDKLRRGIRAIYDCLGLTAPQEVWHKYLIAMPDVLALEKTYAGQRDRYDADLSRRDAAERRPPHPPAEKRAGISVFLHREALHGRGRVGDGKADHAEGICPVSHGGRHGAACGPQDEIPLLHRWAAV